MKLEISIAEQERNKPTKAEMTMAATLLSVIRGEVGTKDQRKAVIRIAKQVGKDEGDREFSTNIGKALARLSKDYAVKI